MSKQHVQHIVEVYGCGFVWLDDLWKHTDLRGHGMGGLWSHKPISPLPTPIIQVGLQVDSYRHTFILCVLVPHFRVTIRPANLYMQHSHTRVPGAATLLGIELVGLLI
jgi:hypothetical protein